MSRSERVPFGVKLAVLTLVVLSPGPWFGDLFVAMFCDAASSVVESETSAEPFHVRFERSPADAIAKDPAAAWNAHVVVVGGASHGELSLHLRTAAYIPIAALIALAFASRRPPRGRWRALALGLLGLAPFVAIRVSVPVWMGLVRWGFVSANPLTRVLLTTAYNGFDTLPCLPFAVPVLIWAMLFWWPTARGQRGSPAPSHQDFHAVR